MPILARSKLSSVLDISPWGTTVGIGTAVAPIRGGTFIEHAI